MMQSNDRRQEPLEGGTNPSACLALQEEGRAGTASYTTKRPGECSALRNRGVTKLGI